MRQCLRLPFTTGPYRGWVHALLGVVAVSAVALAAAGLLILWPTAVPATVFAAAAWLLTGAVGLLAPVRRASVRLANGLLGTGLPHPLHPRRTATALGCWTLAGSALAAAGARLVAVGVRETSGFWEALAWSRFEHLTGRDRLAL